jgi:hypothetical protein
MHLQEALDVAQRINRTLPTWTILAIGRFVPPAELRGDEPWKISVIPRGQTKPKMIHSMVDREYAIAETFGGKAVGETKPAGMLF